MTFQRICLLFTFVFTISYCSFGQCGAEIPKDHKLNPRVLPHLNKSTIQYDLDRTLTMSIWIVANGPDSYNYAPGDAEAVWEDVNIYFEPIGLSFEICNVGYIPNYNWDILNRMPDDEGNSEETNMLAQYHVPNTINVYYIAEIDQEPTVDGYAYFPGGPDVIVMRKGHGQWTPHHEMGHFFGLYHPFETEFGDELVDGSNCTIAGDFVCDTPADINGAVDGCTYVDLSTDANGEYYIPHLSNIMSYYPGDCVCRFTNDQYNRMAWFYLNERNYLW